MLQPFVIPLQIFLFFFQDTEFQLIVGHETQIIFTADQNNSEVLLLLLKGQLLIHCPAFVMLALYSITISTRIGSQNTQCTRTQPSRMHPTALVCTLL